jgi:UDP-glucose 4-epimerase
MEFKILLTGGAGYIGSHVAHLLIDKGHSVSIIDSLITGDRKLVPKKAKLYICDIGDKLKVSKIIKQQKFDLVMHFAGLIRVEESIRKPEKYINYNYKKSKIFLNTCFKYNLKKIIFSSTASVYGNVKNKALENDKINPLNPYALSKLKTENYIIQQSKKKSISYIILRYFNVAGADKKLRTGLISKYSTHLIKIACEVAVGKRDKLIINGDNYDTKDGTTVRDYIHVSDLAEIHYLCGKDLIMKNKSNIFNCGYGKGVSVKEVLKNLNKILGFNIPTIVGKRRPGDSKKVVSNTNKLNKYFSWKPKYNNLKLILNTSLKWENKLKTFFSDL